MTATKLATLFVLTLLSLGNGMAAEVEVAHEEIVVTGRLPGPPLWKVSKDENVLWIFPLLAWVPKDMVWENERVARVIADSQEALSLPQWGWGASPLVKINPISIARNKRLNKRTQGNPDGGTLEENLPPELYARFAALKARYFPRNDDPLEARPAVAGKTMMNHVRQGEGLISGIDILKKIRSLERRNRAIKRTEIAEIKMIDKFGEYADGVEAAYEGYPREQELACFEQQVRHVEEDLDELQSRANSWAQGDIDEFRNAPLAFPEASDCAELWDETMVGMKTRVNQMWLIAAENALATNASTFATLLIEDLLAEDGLLSKLKEKGYEVTEP